MNVILGIDPGSRITGYGIIARAGRGWRYLDSGCIRMATDADLSQRLLTIATGITTLIQQWQPDAAVVEQVFLARNADSALKLGQARGAAITALALGGIPVHEYTARQIKQAVVGTGAADKAQVQHMVTQLLQLTATPQADAADALAGALCHAHAGDNLRKMALDGMRHGRAR